METVKPLTWEEAKDQVAKEYGWKNWYDYNYTNEFGSCPASMEEKFDKAAELYASSRVREVEEEVSKLERHVSQNANTALLLINRNEELEQENKRLQERLEAAEKMLIDEANEIPKLQDFASKHGDAEGYMRACGQLLLIHRLIKKFVNGDTVTQKEK